MTSISKGKKFSMRAILSFARLVFYQDGCNDEFSIDI